MFALDKSMIRTHIRLCPHLSFPSTDYLHYLLESEDVTYLLTLYNNTLLKQR